MAIEILRQVAMRPMPFDIKDSERQYDAVLLLRAAGLVAGLSMRDGAVGPQSSACQLLRVLAVTPRGRRAIECGHDEPETMGMCTLASSRLQR